MLDLTDAVDDIEKEVDISAYLPAGVTLADNKQAKISVAVRIEKHERRTFQVPTANITVSNVNSRYVAKFLEDTVEVELEGLSSELEALDASTLTGSIDVSGMLDGEHTVNLELKLDDKFTLVKNATVTVDIIPKDEVSAPGAGSGDSEENKPDSKNPEEEDSEKKETNTNGTDAPALGGGKKTNFPKRLEE